MQGLKAPYRTLLIEDDATLRAQTVLDLNNDRRLLVVGEADCWDSAQQLITEHDFDLVLLDLQLGHRLALDLITLASPQAKVVAWSVYGDANVVVAALSAGASGYLHKGAAAIELAETLVGVMHGDVPISPTVAGHLLEHLRQADLLPAEQRPNWQLTKRELEVLCWLARGLTYREVGERCDITFHTVAYHVKQIYEKMHVNSRSAAVYAALDSGVIKL